MKFFSQFIKYFSLAGLLFLFSSCKEENHILEVEKSKNFVNIIIEEFHSSYFSIRGSAAVYPANKVEYLKIGTSIFDLSDREPGNLNEYNFYLNDTLAKHKDEFLDIEFKSPAGKISGKIFNYLKEEIQINYSKQDNLNHGDLLVVTIPEGYKNFQFDVYFTVKIPSNNFLSKYSLYYSSENNTIEIPIPYTDGELFISTIRYKVDKENRLSGDGYGKVSFSLTQIVDKTMKIGNGLN